LRVRGFSLLETMLTLSLLFLGMWVTFALFERATRAFSVSGAQNDLSGDARRSLLALIPDLRLADADTLSLDDSRTSSDEAGHTVHRDAFCLATLSRWDKPENFNLVQAGIYWDTYSIVYANRAPRGTLVRQNYRPAGAPFAVPGMWVWKHVWPTIFTPMPARCQRAC
jgi:type II secretory pathway component PulJ